MGLPIIYNSVRNSNKDTFFFVVKSIQEENWTKSTHCTLTNGALVELSLAARQAKNCNSFLLQKEQIIRGIAFFL